jgi:osmotically inducible protein OsmC
MKALYTAEATSTGDGRNGHVRSADGLIDMDLAIPVEMGGAGGGSNPEELFASGFSACFHSALRLVAKRAGANVDGSEVTARVGIGPTGQGAFQLTVALTARLPGVPREQADRLVAEAHTVCPYSNATRGNIDVSLAVA